jgi:nicotinamidase-related amidase
VCSEQLTSLQTLDERSRALTRGGDDCVSSDRYGPLSSVGMDVSRTCAQFHHPQTALENLMTNALPELDPSSTALLLLDIQHAMVGALGDEAAAPVIANAVVALEWARGNNIHVAHIRVGFAPTEAAGIPDTNKAFAPLRGVGMMIDGSPEVDIIGLVKPTDHERVFRKIRFGAFSTTALGSWLEASKIDTVILAGITTGGVVLSTVREAADRDLRAVVLRDATADPDPVVHEVLIERVFPASADVVSTAQLTG